jgi:hypothetical protein
MAIQSEALQAACWDISAILTIRCKQARTQAAAEVTAGSILPDLW